MQQWKESFLFWFSLNGNKTTQQFLQFLRQVLKVTLNGQQERKHNVIIISDDKLGKKTRKKSWNVGDVGELEKIGIFSRKLLVCFGVSEHSADFMFYILCKKKSTILRSGVFPPPLFVDKSAIFTCSLIIFMVFFK